MTNLPSSAQHRKRRSTLGHDPLEGLEAVRAAPPPAAVSDTAAARPFDTPTAVPPIARTEPMTTAAKSASREQLGTFEALNTLSTPVTLADNDHVIRFVNEAGYRMFEVIEADIRRDLPHFVARDVLGRKVDVFHKNPAYQHSILRNMTKPHDGKFTVGGRHLIFRATPIEMEGAMQGVLVEWRDNTAVVEGERNIAQLLTGIRAMSDAHTAGDIEHFISPDHLSPDLVQVVEGVNAMVQGHIDSKRKTLAVVAEFARGNFDAVLAPFPGKRRFLNDTVEEMREAFRKIFGQIRAICEALEAGNLDVAIDPASFDGEYRSIVSALESVVGSLNRKVFAQIRTICEALEAGNLDVAIDTASFQGEYRSIVSALESAVISLSRTIASATEQVKQVAITVDQMSQSSQALATNSQIQSSSVDEVSASAEQTNIQVKSNASAADSAAHLVAGAATLAEDGTGKIKEMVSAMEGIRVSSQDIAKIIKVIDEIAFQTNLLALNAAVEAARAGQHGRGFAVVAQEVRNLAGRSAKAARETSDLIEGASSRVQSGVRIADETRQVFSRIADDIQKVQTLVTEIAVASDEQARGVTQINSAIGEVARSALSTSQQADELAASAAEMAAATETMRTDFDRFTPRRVEPTRTAGLLPEGLPPELLAQLRQFLVAQGASGANIAAVQPSQRAESVPAQKRQDADRDERGFSGF